MANKSDILLKYKTTYSQFEKDSIDRLNQLKRSFNNEKDLYQADLARLDNELKINQNSFYQTFMSIHKDYLQHENDLKDHYFTLKNDFNEDIFHQMNALDEQAEVQTELYDEILEEFDLRKQEALDTYIQLTKHNNAIIDKELNIHRQYIEQEKQKLLTYKQSYDDLSSQLSNKMIWTIEKAKNAIEVLNNKLEDINKEDLFSLNQQILQALTDLRGTRNDINVIFKDTSNQLNEYKEEIYKLRKAKQKPYSSINHQLIQKLIGQIRNANINKQKYQEIINQDLKESLDKLYPLILKAHNENKHDLLEKYILQTEILQEKAAFLNKKIEKITNYNISTYQNRIKEIKVEIFTRNEEIKFSYSVPMKYIENAVNIYSNYNFYFNQGFNDLDKLLSDLIAFSQKFNDVRNKESIQVKGNLTAYQNNFLAKISDVSNHLSSLLFQIDDIAFQISTLESSNRLEIGEIKKEIANVDIKGDYKKYLDSLEADYQIAQKEYRNRIKTINLKKLYKDRTLELYQSAIHMDLEKERLYLSQTYQQSINDIESETHKDYYDYIKAKYDIYYQHQEKMLDKMMHIIKEKLIQNLKATNYQLAKGYFDYANNLQEDKMIYQNSYHQIKRRLTQVIHENDKQTQSFVSYLSKTNDENPMIAHFEQMRLQLHNQLDQAEEHKTKVSSQRMLDVYEQKHQLEIKINQLFNTLKEMTKNSLRLLHQDNDHTAQIKANIENYRHILYAFTSTYYDVVSFNYQYHYIKETEALNNYYDDITYKIVEDSTILLDKLNSKNNKKKQTDYLNAYLIELLDTLNNIQTYFNAVISNAHDAYIQPSIKRIAYIKLETEKEKSMINDFFDSLGKQSLKQKENRQFQQTLIRNVGQNLDTWMNNQIIYAENILIKKQKQGSEALNSVHQKVSKIINNNDKQLSKIIKEVDQMFIDQFQLMTKDYHQQMALIKDLKDKIMIDTNIEKQYIDFTIKQAIQEIDLTKADLYKQINQVPIERSTRLNEVESSRQLIFNQYQAQLQIKYAEAEKEKFTQIPLLEQQILDKENQVRDEFEKLYIKHQNLEKGYLDEYTNTNNDFISLHKGFQEDLINSKLQYDHILNQPLKDLLDTENAVIEKVDIVHQEVSSKTKDKVKEIYDDKKDSQNKQDRIIHS